MSFILISWAFLSAAAPATGAVPTTVIQEAAAADAEAEAEADDKKKRDFDMAAVMAMFDKMFPQQPEPEPERLALARVTAGGMLPGGTYAGIFDEMMSGMVDHVLSLSAADFASKNSKTKPASTATLRQEMAKDDPHFEERFRIMRRVVREELVKISAVLEPKLREGLARSIARRLDEPQLRELNAFLATDSGRAFAAHSMRMWIDPDVMRSMVQAFPHMITAVPGAMVRLEAETAHLPKPKKKEPAKKAAEPTT